jgi:hypothetical protein
MLWTSDAIGLLKELREKDEKSANMGIDQVQMQLLVAIGILFFLDTTTHS